MNRVRKLILNTFVIICVLFLIYYFGGFYISREQCIQETMKALYANETERIYDFEHNHRYKSVYWHPDNKTVSIIGTKQFGFLYQTDSCSTSNQIREDMIIDIIGSYNRDFGGMVVVIYRNDPNVSKIIVDYEPFDVQLDFWNGDFTGAVMLGNELYRGIYRVYDHQDQLLAEMEY